MPTNTSRASIQIISLIFFLFLAGNTQLQRILGKWMPYNTIWIINLLNEDEFDIQNYLYPYIFFWPKWYFGHRNLDTPSWVTSAWSFYTFLPANSWAAFPPRRPWVSASNYTVLFYQSGIYFDREFETIADTI